MKAKRTIILIISLLLVTFACSIWLIILPFCRSQWPPKARVTITQMQLSGLCLDLQLLREKNGAYPKDYEHWCDWLGFAENDKRRETKFLDGWGRPIRYVVDRPKLNPGKFDLYSVGKNGIDEYEKPDFGDDIYVKDDHVLFGELRKRTSHNFGSTP
jgi:hypothetical protein